jgi:hypothetical protein
MRKSAIYILSLSVIILIVITAYKSKETNHSSDKPYILVEIYEVPNYPRKGIHIHYGNGKKEHIPFKDMGVDYHDEAGALTLQAINKLEAEGYGIESTASGLAQSGMITKIFMRKR